MKVTNEMRRIIERQLAKKARKDQRVENDRRRALADAVNAQLLESAEYKAMLEAEKAFDQKIAEAVKATDGVERRYQSGDGYPRKFVIPACIEDELYDMCDRVILELSCGKDLDAAREILKKYGIEL